ncbi:MAG: RagB/SusD family nutrient uptake outer membrane protein [Salinivirgaceae bacterium]|nr:RagB/SusD family nutrient uptake outer membrane protein [Salinivirgaceae bacterium]
MKKIIYISLVLIVTSISCTDLNEDVLDSISSNNYPETPEQIAVQHLESYNALSSLWDDGGYWFLAQEVSSDEMVAPTRGPHWFDGGKWLQLQYHNWNDQSDPPVGMWRDIFRGIVTSNKINDKLKAGGGLAQSKISEVEAIRSFYYYIFMDNFGDVPYLDKYIGAPEKPFRNNRTEIFDSLTTTLERGLKNLPSISNPAYKNYASKEMAQALLVKLYLNGKVYAETDDQIFYEKAIQYCDSLIANVNLFLEPDPLDAFKVDNTNSSEVIFAVPFDEVNKEGFRLHMRSLHYNHNETFDMAAGPWNGFCVIPDHFDTYQSIDKRKSGYFLWGPQFTYSGSPLMVDGKQLDIDYKIPYPNMPVDGPLSIDFITNCGARIQKFEIYKDAKENLTVNFPVFRLSDIYLMKAEAELRSSGLTPATLTLVNQIRSRASIAEWNLGEVTLDSIYAERGRELYAEGHRRNDMIRFGKFDQPFWGKGDETDPNDPGQNAIENIFPIPLNARTTNPNLDLEPKPIN